MCTSFAIRAFTLPGERKAWNHFSSELVRVQAQIIDQQSSKVWAAISYSIGLLTGDKIWSGNLYSLQDRAKSLDLFKTQETALLCAQAKKRGGLLSLALTSAALIYRGVCSYYSSSSQSPSSEIEAPWSSWQLLALGTGAGWIVSQAWAWMRSTRSASVDESVVDAFAAEAKEQASQSPQRQREREPSLKNLKKEQQQLKGSCPATPHPSPARTNDVVAGGGAKAFASRLSGPSIERRAFQVGFARLFQRLKERFCDLVERSSRLENCFNSRASSEELEANEKQEQENYKNWAGALEKYRTDFAPQHVNYSVTQFNTSFRQESNKELTASDVWVLAEHLDSLEESMNDWEQRVQAGEAWFNQCGVTIPELSSRSPSPTGDQNE